MAAATSASARTSGFAERNLHALPPAARDRSPSHREPTPLPGVALRVQVEATHAGGRHVVHGEALRQELVLCSGDLVLAGLAAKFFQCLELRGVWDRFMSNLASYDFSILIVLDGFHGI